MNAISLRFTLYANFKGSRVPRF